MPIDKFGRHMLRASPYTTFQKYVGSEPFYFCQPVNFNAPCLIYIKGEYDPKQSIAFYKLENGQVAYKSPISGSIKNITLSPKVKVFLNNEGFEYQEILNKNLKEGDELNFLYDSTNKNFYAEILVSCSVTNDG